ncbi:hypothetical protein FPCIR_14248 [Fusarium pseudocircinatum]|uniref:Uncharacterized protein n=1 Tax=Fusarium pseudocircinatum TaxID=56676 RepID=A0A8H5NN02_9HYPO|nr:hypothetical protein FPCIR_14248 [Fusarium pseudocircinatum]
MASSSLTLSYSPATSIIYKDIDQLTDNEAVNVMQAQNTGLRYSTFGNTEKKIPGVGEELFAVQTPAKAPLLLGYLEQSEHYIESRLEASNENSSALYDASKDPSMIQDPTLS